MNHKIMNIMTIGVAAMAMVACSDSFLDVDSKTTLPTELKTQTQAEYAVVGCYDGYQRTVSNGNWPTLFQAVETMSDDCLGGGGPDDRQDRLMDRFDINYKSDASDIFEGLWKDYYSGIFRCNVVTNSLASISFSSQKEKNIIEGQARAIRGLEYFDLVRMFENVPLVTVPTTDIMPQSPKDEVYKQIVEDLTFAADSIPSTQFLNTSTELGRISKYAAAAMLARVYLFYDGVYNNNQRQEMPGGLTKEKALKYCEMVIDSAKYSLEPEFKNLWPGACTEATTSAQGRKSSYVEGSKEILWVVKFNNDQFYGSDENPSPANGNRFIINLGLRGVQSYAPYGNGWGACPITPYAQSIYTDGDTRAQATIIDCRAIGSYTEQKALDGMDFTGYVNKKYTPLIFTDGVSMPLHESTAQNTDYQLTQDQDWILMRYSDVLLMAAELGSSKSLEYFNQVRERAYGNKDHNLTTEPTRKQIWDERRKEFMGEGIRYWDLLRQGLDAFVDAQLGQAASNGSKTGTSISVYDNSIVTTDIKDTYKEENIRSKRGFFQIPKNQISLSGGLYKQNAGW